MFKKKNCLHIVFLGVIAIVFGDNQSSFARHHHKNGPPPPLPVETAKDTHLNPKQNTDDLSPFAQRAAENARRQANLGQQAIDKPNGPPALIPGHYTKRSKKVNGTDGWVNSKQRTGKYDLGINMPVGQGADPTQNKTRGVFRRAMPMYEPNY